MTADSPASHGSIELSIVSPVYGGERLVDELVRQLSEEAERLTAHFEIVLVDDGSTDGSWARIRALATLDERVKGLRLSRNFGQHLAIAAGLDHAVGEWVAVMDCDLQDDPRDLGLLWAKAHQGGCDIVFAEKRVRAHGLLKNTFGRLYARTLGWLSGGPPASAHVGAYSMISRRVIDAYQRIREPHQHYLLVLRWLGFPSATVPVDHRPRTIGRSNYNAARLMRHAINGFVAQSNRLLYLGLAIGGVFLCASLVGAILLVTMYFLHGFREGWTSIAVLILLSTSVILMSIGTVGVYLGKVFDQVKQRPLYLLQDRINI